MHVPRPRFTVRQIMIAVAFVAVVVRRRDYCLSRAAWHARREASRRADEQWTQFTTLMIAHNLTQADANEHARLRSMYETIASRPLEPLPDDPFLKEPPGENPFELNSP
jgi:hypothetical protein